MAGHSARLLCVLPFSQALLSLVHPLAVLDPQLNEPVNLFESCSSEFTVKLNTHLFKEHFRHSK